MKAEFSESERRILAFLLEEETGSCRSISQAVGLAPATVSLAFQSLSDWIEQESSELPVKRGRKPRPVRVRPELRDVLTRLSDVEHEIRLRRVAARLGVPIGNTLIVLCGGGVAAGASDKIREPFEAIMREYETHGNGPQRTFLPEVRMVPPGDAQVFEMFGAEPIMRDILTRSEPRTSPNISP